MKPNLGSTVTPNLDHPVYQQALAELKETCGTIALDVGAGTGENVRFLRSLGIRCVALEYDADYAKRIDGPVIRGAANSLPTRAGTIDAISMMHVLEHVPQCHEAIREVRRALRPGGTLVLEVPNKWTLQELLNYVNTRFLLPAGARHLGHCNFFDCRTLRRLLEKEGFSAHGTKLWGGPARATTTTAVDLALRLLFKGALRPVFDELRANNVIAAVHARLSRLYTVLSRLDEWLARRTAALVTVVGFACRVRPPAAT